MGEPGLRTGMASARADLDVVLCVAAVALYPLAVAFLEAGSWLRLAALAPLLLFVPGYLLLQAVEPKADLSRRATHAAVALGVSPALVGVAALATALEPGGFTQGRILVAQIVLVLVLGALAGARRALVRRADRRAAGAAGSQTHRPQTPVDGTASIVSGGTTDPLPPGALPVAAEAEPGGEGLSRRPQADAGTTGGEA